MIVLGIYGSPRKGGNTDTLLDKVLDGAGRSGAQIRRIYVRDLKISGCIECGGCDKTGECILDDDMQLVYPVLDEANIIFLASPIFFYGLTSQAKALIDRSQARWAKRMLTKSPDKRRQYDGGQGYLISVGATKGKNLFEGAELTAKYFFDALDMKYRGGLFFRRFEEKDHARKSTDTMEKAFEFGKKAVVSYQRKSAF